RQTLPLHDALPLVRRPRRRLVRFVGPAQVAVDEGKEMVRLREVRREGDGTLQRRHGLRARAPVEVELAQTELHLRTRGSECSGAQQVAEGTVGVAPRRLGPRHWAGPVAAL